MTPDREPDLFDDPPHYPDVPGWKGRHTARDAARLAEAFAPTIRGAALRTLQAHPAGLTADEVADTINRSILAVRPRLSELSKMGLIFDSGTTRANTSGVQAIVWRAI